MALVSQFKFTNKTAGSNTVTPLALDLVTNYAVSEETANDSVLNNKTAPIDAAEVVSFRSRNLGKVNTSLPIMNPAKVKAGIEYGVRLEDTLVTTDTVDASFRVDEPIVISLNIRHPKSGNFSNAVVGECFLRLISALMKADGSWRFDDLMRSAERPIIA